MLFVKINLSEFTMISKTLIRAYPITVLVKVITDVQVKEALAKMMKLGSFDVSRAERIKNKAHTISYLKEHYEEETKGDKPLSVMATKHKNLVIDYLMEISVLQNNANFEMHVEYEKLINIISDKAELIEKEKEINAPELAQQN